LVLVSGTESGSFDIPVNAHQTFWLSLPAGHLHLAFIGIVPIKVGLGHKICKLSEPVSHSAIEPTSGSILAATGH